MQLTSILITLTSLAALTPTVLSVGVKPGSKCNKLGAIACEFKGNHIMRCKISNGDQRWTKVANCGTRQVCVNAHCTNRSRVARSFQEMVEKRSPEAEAEPEPEVEE